MNDKTTEERGILKRDLVMAYVVTKGPRWKRVLECVRNPALHAVITFRFGHWLLSQPFIVRLFLKPLYMFENHHLRARWGIEIGPEARIGPGFFIWHYGGIFIGGNVVAGENLIISQGVTIGFSKARTKQGHPTIGNNVYIAPGAKVAGKITIGDNVRIGANAVVERSVPANALVQVRPMQVVKFPTYYGGGDCCEDKRD